MKKGKILLFILIGLCIMPVTGVCQKKSFVRTVDLLVIQIDKQIADRDRLIAELKILANKLQGVTQYALEERIDDARMAVSERESFRLAETLANEPNRYIVKTRIMDFLQTVTENDQALYDEYLEQKSANGFQLEKQLAKIKTEQTKLSAIRRDLEKIKFYPLKKERAAFFLSAVTNVIDGLRTAQGF